MTKQIDKKRNGTISLLKFLFCIVVLLHHAKDIVVGKTLIYNMHGYIVNDFFFIVSGYYFYNSILKLDNVNIYKENVKIIINKFKRFLPLSIVSGAITIIICLLTRRYRIPDAVLSVFNIFLIDMCGLEGNIINGPVWYISSFIIVTFVLLPIIYKNKDKYVYYICPIIIMFGLGYLYQKYPTLDLYRNEWNFLYPGLIRAFIDINIGIIVYKISNVLKEHLINNKKWILLDIVCGILYLMIFYFIFVYSNKIVIDYFVFLLIIICTIINFSEYKVASFFDTKFVRYLERLSLYIFFNQTIFWNLFVNMSISKFIGNYSSIILYCLGTIIFSIIQMFVTDKIKSKSS